MAGCWRAWCATREGQKALPLAAGTPRATGTRSPSGSLTGYVSALISRRGNCCFTTSMGGRGDEYLDGFSKYLKDEHTAKGYPGLFDKEEWKLVPTATGAPQQQNG